jgi:hypothetical protein
MHRCSLTIFFMRWKPICVLQATRIASQLSTIIRFQTFLTRSSSPFWDRCLSLSTIPSRVIPGVSTPSLPPPSPITSVLLDPF